MGQDDIRFWNQRGRYFMQKTMRYHIADGENQPVVRAVALVVRREPDEAQEQPEQTQTQPQVATTQHGKSRWIRPSLRKAQPASS